MKRDKSPQEQQIDATWKVIKFAAFVIFAIWFLSYAHRRVRFPAPRATTEVEG